MGATGAGTRSRRGLLAAGLAAVALTAAACGGGGSSGSGGGSLRYGYDLSAQFTDTFDVSKSSGDCDQIVLFHIYDTLLHWDGTDLQPGLAEDFELDADGITLTLREGLTFSDGQPLDAEAVKQGLEQNKGNDQLTSLLKVESIDTPDDRTVRINTVPGGSIEMLYSLSSREGMIMAPGSYETADSKPVGAGPFELAEYAPGEAIELVRNDEYWDRDAYDFEGIVFTQVGTGPPALDALRAGSVDIVRAESDAVAAIEGDDEFTTVKRPTSAYLQLQMRRSKDGSSPFDDVRVRQAIHHAIDKEKINDRVQNGAGEIAWQGLPKDSPGHNPEIDEAYPYDPEKARQLLAEAGYPNGFEFTMAIPGGNISNMETQAALIQDMLKDVGVTANVTRVLGSDIATQYYIQGGGDAFAAARLAAKVPDGPINDQYGKFQFVAIWNNNQRDDLTQLMTEARTLLAEGDLDAAYAKIREGAKIVSDESLEVPIAFMPQVMVYDKARVGGEVKGQTNICDPPDLSGLTMKD